MNYAGSSKIKIEQLTSECVSRTVESKVWLGMIIYAGNHSIQEAEAGASVDLKPDQTAYKIGSEGKREGRKEERASLSSKERLCTHVHTIAFTPANQKQSLTCLWIKDSLLSLGSTDCSSRGLSSAPPSGISQLASCNSSSRGDLMPSFGLCGPLNEGTHTHTQTYLYAYD